MTSHFLATTTSMGTSAEPLIFAGIGATKEEAINYLFSETLYRTVSAETLESKGFSPLVVQQVTERLNARLEEILPYDGKPLPEMVEGADGVLDLAPSEIHVPLGFIAKNIRHEDS